MPSGAHGVHTLPNAPVLVIIGAGPAGLMAAETAAAAGVRGIHVFDAMPSVGRKLLLAGIGGLNLTHSEPAADFATRFGTASPQVAAWLANFDAAKLRAWCAELGVDTFIGSSGRVFPTSMKAAPLLRAWLAQLKSQGVQFHARRRWQGFAPDGALQFESPEGAFTVKPQACVLALGGGSWSKLGSDGAWVPWLRAAGVQVADLQPSNCGFNVAWSPFFVQRCAGQVLKNVAIAGKVGECQLTAYGIEGGLIYAHSAFFRDHIAAQGQAILTLDLAPQAPLAQLVQTLRHARGARSIASHLQSRAGITGARAVLLRECLPKAAFDDMAALAAGIKACPITLQSPRPLDEAISSAGGVKFADFAANGQLHRLKNVFVAGEMLDWEAPTGGYLLTACMASGREAGAGAADFLAQKS